MHRILRTTLALIAGAALAQSFTPAANAASPVAYVYVSRPTHVDGFAVAANGQLTALPGSPLANTNVSKLSVTKKFLFGLSGDGSEITSFAIAADGSIKKVSSLGTWQYESGVSFACVDYPDMQVDTTGTTVYSQVNPDCAAYQTPAYISLHVESNGDLQYLGGSGGYIDDAGQGDVVSLTMAGTGKFGYDGWCGEDDDNLAAIDIYKRESNGLLQYVGQDTTAPTDYTGAAYCAGQVAADSANHLAVAYQREDDKTGDNGYFEGPYFLASFTEDASGNLTTTSGSDNMPEAMVSNNFDVTTMSISPANKFLAVGGLAGFQIFHFNGGSPITADSGVFLPAVTIQKFGWDKANHLFVLGGGSLYVYTVTASGVSGAPGSPYSIPESSGVIVLDLQ
jgi:hypothetical protein